MHNYSDFFEEYLKSGQTVTTLSILSCWLLGFFQALPLMSTWNNPDVSDFTSCSLPFLSPAWIWGVAITVFIIPTIVIVVSYGMIAKQLFRDSTGDSEAFQVIFCYWPPHVISLYQVTFVMISLTAAFLFCWWPVCIYLSVRWKDGIGSRGFYYKLITIINIINFVIILVITVIIRFLLRPPQQPGQPDPLHLPQLLPQGQGRRYLPVPQTQRDPF